MYGVWLFGDFFPLISVESGLLFLTSRSKCQDDLLLETSS